MSSKQPALLMDLGGTHIRLACASAEGDFENWKKYKINNFQSLKSIVESYKSEFGVAEFSKLLLASARWPEDGSFQYKTYGGDHILDIDVSGLATPFTVLNDYQATAYGLIGQGLESCLCLDRAGDFGGVKNQNLCIAGIGTGVGHAFVIQAGQDNLLPQVLCTFGGHFDVVLSSYISQEMIDLAKAHFAESRDLVLEDFVSSRGLKLLCAMYLNEDFRMMSDDYVIEIISKNMVVREAVSTHFSALIGLHCQMLVLVSACYGGVVLTGGLFEILMAHHLFDAQSFRKAFVGNHVGIVDKTLRSISLYKTSDEDTALYGLSYIAEREG